MTRGRNQLYTRRVRRIRFVRAGRENKGFLAGLKAKAAPSFHSLNRITSRADSPKSRKSIQNQKEMLIECDKILGRFLQIGDGYGMMNARNMAL
ncbi:MAG: hypothetical protein IK099_02460 [Clostridia bacterium]|nr:hypothetical protein [Clostridia bacterium]